VRVVVNRRPRSLRVLAVLLATLAWLICGPARAAEVDARCLATRALAGLAPEEQQRLSALCSGHARPAPDDAPLLARLVVRASWESAALAELVDGGAPHLDLERATTTGGAATRLLAVRRGLQGLAARRSLAGAGCTGVREAVAEYFTDLAAGDVPAPPFTRSKLEDGRCVPLDPIALADAQLLTIAGDDTDAVFVAAAAGERVVLQWLGPDEAIVHEGRRVFVVAVPPWSVVTVRATVRDSAVARTWHGFVARDQTLWDHKPEAGCLRLSVDLDADTALLLDGRLLTRGQRLAHRAVGVHAGDHELVALRCTAKGECSVRFRESLAAGPRTGTQNLCQDVGLDLHQPRSVAILRTVAAPGCDAALAWQAGVLAADYLRRNEAVTGRVFRDLASYATLTKALGSLRTSLNPAAGAAVGAETGADSLELVGTVAKEAWRQGIDELITLELRCAGDGDGLSLEGNALSVREIFTRARGELAGLDLKQLLRVQSLRLGSEAQLESTVGGVLDQLLGRSYLRIREGAAAFPYRQTARFELAAFGETTTDGRPSLNAYRLADAHLPSPPLCRTLRGPDERAGFAAVETLTRSLGAARLMRIRGDDETADAGHTEIRSAKATQLTATLRADEPGTYLIVARWLGASGRAGPVVDATCVRFEVPDGELWASISFTPDLTLRTPVRELRSRHLRVMLGHTWYRPLRWLGLGVAGGYTYTSYLSEAGLPSWQDFTVTPSQTRAALEWHRHAIVVGPLVELRSRRATWPVELRARLSAGLGVALIDVSRLISADRLGPDSSFATPAQFGTENLRVRPTFDATLELGFGYYAGPVAMTHVFTLGMVGINDMTSAARAVTAVSGAGLFAGFGLILGGAP
jgi:hypothetical protein